MLRINGLKVCYSIIVVLLFLVFKASGQDIHFTQFFANKLYLAPSFAGATAQNRIISAYRNQWPQVKGYVTYSTSFDHNFANFNSGLGVMAIGDVAGTGRLGSMLMGISYSYDFQVNQNLHIRPGISFSYWQRTIDYLKLIMGDQLTESGINPSSVVESFGNTKIGAFDAASSVIVYTKDIWIGSTLDHLLRPNLSLMGGEERIPFRLTVYGGITMLRKGRLLRPIDETLSVAFLYSHQLRYDQINLGLYWSKSPLVLGVWYRGIPIFNSDRGDSFALLAGLKIPDFSLGYSYDFTISNLINKTSGTHEVTLVLEFSKTRKRKLHMVPCPEF